MFIDVCKKLKIMKGSDAIGLGESLFPLVNMFNVIIAMSCYMIDIVMFFAAAAPRAMEKSKMRA